MTGTSRYALALTAGTLLSGAAAGLLGTLGPSAGFPRLSWRHPWTAYATLAAAPTGSATVIFAVSAVIYAVCLAVAGLTARRHPAATLPEEPVQ